MAALETPNYLHVSRSAIEVVLFGVMSLGAFAAIQRAHLTDREKWRFGLTAAATSFAWLLLMTGLSAGGLFVPGATGPVPAILRGAAGPVPVILPAMLLPILVFSLVLARSKSAVAVLDAIPHDWLIRVQVFRALGGVFLLLYLDGLIPGVFALPAGLGDVATGMLALPVAYLVARNSSWARLSAYAWNIFGILDLVIAVTLGSLTSPGPFQQLALENPNVIIGEYPLVMIPVFAVPVAIILHILSLRKLKAEENFETAPRFEGSGATSTRSVISDPIPPPRT